MSLDFFCLLSLTVISKMPPSKTNLRLLQWAANSRALTYSILEVLSQYPLLKKAIWPAPGDDIQGKKKAMACQDIAKRLLGSTPPYDELIKTDTGRKAYGTSVKNQVIQMEKRWREAFKTLGVTGAGLNNEDEIWEGEQGDKLCNVWHEAQKVCPYFYDMKPLLGERLIATDHAIGNSVDLIDISGLLGKKFQS